MKPLIIEDDLPVIKPLTLICGDGQADVETREGIKLTPEMRLQQADWSFGLTPRRFGSRVPEFLERFYPDSWSDEMFGEQPSRQTRYIVGMIEQVTGTLAMMKRMGKYVPLLIIEPEAGLHPKHQQTMTNFLIEQMNLHRTSDEPQSQTTLPGQ